MRRNGPPLGAHVSVAGGVHTAPERGKRIGADVVQIFSKHNTRWEGKPLEPDDARALREESGRTGVAVAAVHCAYLINLGSSKEPVRTRCALRAFGKFPAGVTLLLENTAGQGNSIGRTMGQLRDLLDAAGCPPDVAVCLDSAHLFESGSDVGTEEGWEGALAEMEEKGILPLVRMWHLNDSKTAMGSRVDRHQHIGEGRIGLPGFRRILTHKGFSSLPMILETPKDGEDEFEMDVRNLAALRKLLA
ncbi:MAG: apurinic endonuclease Apn1 [Deltaproteobacteria bacterium]|nr:apurinic endonuclease Apn1 [Deltaproteobacteria bacterium]